MNPIIKIFIERFEKAMPNEFRAIQVKQNGKIWGEAFYDYKHTRIHSCSKSITATAIGIAIGEGLLSLDDKVVNFFPELLPQKMDDKLCKLTLRHCLMMSSGHDYSSIPGGKLLDYEKPDWMEQYLSKPFYYEPGEHFHYESGDSMTAAFMLNKKTGVSTLEYLRPRLFEPLGIEGVYAWQTPDGFDQTAFGIHMKRGDLIKFAELYLNKGNWNGRQILSPEWTADATACHISTDMPPGITGDIPNFYGIQCRPNYERYGYGYQIWRTRYDGFCANGGTGQTLAIGLPKYNVCVYFSTHEQPTYDLAIDLIWELILPHFA